MRKNLPSTKKLPDILGWFGVVAILVAFTLVSFGFVGGRSLLFQILNLLGSAAIAYDALTNKDKPAAWLNIIYAVIALIALLSVVF